MAETDMKPLSELDLYNNLLDSNSLLPMTVKPSGSSVTRKVYFDALKTQITGYDLVGTLTAGSTSITLPATTPATYDDQTAYQVGTLVTVTENDVTKNYICVTACSAANWATNGRYFVEYTPLSSNSTFRFFTTVLGVNPTAQSISNNTITLTFEAQSVDVGVKVRVE